MSLTRSISVTCAAVLLTAVASVWAALLPYPNTMPKVSTPYDTILKKTWEGIKKRNVDAYGTGMVHRPKSNMPNDAVSEGISYGMFLALYGNDQKYFNSIWDAGEKYMWNSYGKYYDWRRSSTGDPTGDSGPASDAEQDIALLLIFADRLAERGLWEKGYTSVKGATYAARAKDILNTIRTTMVASNGALLPGQWGENGVINPGYFAPAFYRVFAEFDSTNKSSWNALIDGCYTMIAKSPGYSRGLVPDWFNFDGGSTLGAGYNAYFKGDALYRDAIRVYWRLSVDWLWHKEPRAKTFLDNAMAFIGAKGGPPGANFFDMNGGLLPEEDTEILGDGKSVNIERKRREHSPLTVGMWAAAAMGSGGPALAESYSEELRKFYQPGTDYWGYAVDPSGGQEDTLHNEMYFEQFLAWFGASVLGGVFTNVWEDLKEGVPTGPPTWENRPVVTPTTRVVDASVEPLRVTASFNRSVRWTVTITHDTSGREVSFSNSSKNVNVDWYGLSQSHAGNDPYMPQGLYTLTVRGDGINEVYNFKVWLGRPYSNGVNLMVGNRLLVDDFADGDFTPYIGREWASYLDSYEGKNGQSTASLSVKKESDGKEWLSWKYTLRQGGLGYDPHAALEWNCQTGSAGIRDLRGIDSIIVTARSLSGTIGVSVQLVSDDIGGPQYFEDSLYLTAASGEYKLYIPKFKQRMNGEGKNIQATLQKMLGIRFQVQYPDGAANTIMVERMYFTGDSVSKLYTPPPAPPPYVPPTVSLDDPADPGDGVAYRGAKQPKYTIKRSQSAVTIVLPADMTGASASLVDIRGRTLMRLDVQKDGRLSVPLRTVARGLYFVDIRGRGQNIKVKVLKSK